MLNDRTIIPHFRLAPPMNRRYVLRTEIGRAWVAGPSPVRIGSRVGLGLQCHSGCPWKLESSGADTRSAHVPPQAGHCVVWRY